MNFKLLKENVSPCIVPCRLIENKYVKNMLHPFPFLHVIRNTVVVMILNSNTSMSLDKMWIIEICPVWGFLL